MIAVQSISDRVATTDAPAACHCEPGSAVGVNVAKLESALAQVDASFERTKAENAATPEHIRKQAKAALARRDSAPLGNYSKISDAAFDYYTAQAGGRYFA
ncbi:MAG: hypothetical protein ACRCVX_12315 [Shewanella sp.]